MGIFIRKLSLKLIFLTPFSSLMLFIFYYNIFVHKKSGNNNIFDSFFK